MIRRRAAALARCLVPAGPLAGALVGALLAVLVAVPPAFAAGRPAAVAPAVATPAAAPAASGRAATAGGPPAEEAMLDCQHQRVVTPRSFVISCADANSGLTGLSWVAWSPGAAAATGTYTYNTCTPTCAAGHDVSYPALVEVTGALQTNLGLVYTGLAWQYTAGGMAHQMTFPLVAVPEQVVTCGHAPVVRPPSYVVACADGNTRLVGLTWQSWQLGVATATGTLVSNTCTPDCAAGRYVRAPVTVELTGAAVGLPAGLQYTAIDLQWTTNGAHHAVRFPLAS